MWTGSIRDKQRIAVSAFMIFAAVVVSLFAHWEPSEESWAYWLFARIFAQTGQFIILDRSPLYTLYLNLFRWLGYSLSVTVEYVATTLLSLFSLIFLFRRYLSLRWLVFAVILWIPFLQEAEPPVLKLALACSCLAVALRSADYPSRLKYAFSYALLLMAFMFRGTYGICFAAFFFWDVFRIFKSKSFSQLIPRKPDWPVALVIILLIWFSAAQSPHRWNTASIGSSHWFPYNSKSLTDGAFIQNNNSQYILKKYGNFEEKDFYFTNQELFHSATTFGEAVKANPGFVFKQAISNVKDAFIVGVKFTLIPNLFYDKIPKGSRWWYLVHLFITIPVWVIVFWSAFKGGKDNNMRLFLWLNITMLGSLVLVLPKERYMHPIIPVLILSASYYVSRLRSRIRTSQKAVSNALIFLVIIFLLNGVSYSALNVMDWKRIIGDLARDSRRNELRILENREFSLKAAKAKIEPYLLKSKGILSYEHRFMASFMNISLDKFYDIWEIPPFGSLNTSTYNGLRTDRIDCVIVSSQWLKSQGSETNQKIRYENYVKPYVKRLKALGAQTQDIKNYGSVTVLNN